MRVAIVTGASSGLGQEFVLQLSHREPLDEIWVIARREDRLRALAARIPTPVRVLPLDLSKDDSFTRLRALLQQEQPDVRVLVNAAGFGRMGNWAQIPSADNDGMIDLNCKALVRTTTLCLPHMSRGSRVLQVCSSSAFQPLPWLGVYAASKAFVLRYSRALWWEVFSKGIHVTAACPYWVKDTEFIAGAQTGQARPAVRHFPLASKPRSVVALSLLGSRLGLPVASAGPVSLVQRVCAKFMPHLVVDAAWAGIRRL